MPAELARMWASVAAAQSVLGKRRLYYLATGVEELLADQLSLIGMLEDWVPITTAEVAELTRALRAYSGTELDSLRDPQAEALRICIRAMTLGRARSGAPFPPEAEEYVDGKLIG